MFCKGKTIGMRGNEKKDSWGKTKGQDNLEHNLQLLQGCPGYNLFKKNIEENKDNKDNM